jgi:cytochrome c peroxidase
VNDFLSGGIRPLGLTDEEIDDLVAFMKALTSPEFAHLAEDKTGKK